MSAPLDLAPIKARDDKLAALEAGIFADAIATITSQRSYRPEAVYDRRALLHEVDRLRGVVERLEIEKFDLAERLAEAAQRVQKADVETMPIRQRDAYVAAVLQFMRDRGYVFTMPPLGGAS